MGTVKHTKNLASPIMKCYYNHMKLLNEQETMKFLQERGVEVTLPMLRRYRQQGKPPLFMKNQVSLRVAYSEIDLEEFAKRVWQVPEKF